MKQFSLQRMESASHRIFALCGGLALLGYSGLAAAQSDAAIRENLAPVSQLCLAGQDCVGEARRPAMELAAAPQEESASPAHTQTQPETQTHSQSSDAAPDAAPAQDQDQAAQTPPPNAVAQQDSGGADPEAIYQQYCAACHNAGVANAPRPGDAEAWEERTQKGMDAVMANVVTGLNSMPPKGLCMTCSEQDLRAVVDYMIEQSQ